MRLIKFLAVAAAMTFPIAAWATTAQDEVNTANSLAKDGCYDSAIMFYNKALQFSPGYGPAIAGRASAMKKLKKNGGKNAEPKVAKEPAEPESPEKIAEKARKKKEKKEKEKLAAAAAAAKLAAAKAQAKAQPVAAAKPPAKPVATEAVASVAAPSTPTAPAAKPAAPAAESTPPFTPPQETGSSSASSSSQTARPTASEPASSSLSPPVSSIHTGGSFESSGTGADAVPQWLYMTSGITGVLILVLSVVWLMPSLMASRQLHNRLKTIAKD